MKSQFLYLLMLPVCAFADGTVELADTSVARHMNVDEVTVVGFKQDAPAKEALSVTSLSAANIRQAEMTSIKDLG